MNKLITSILDWFKKRRVLPRWRLIGILSFAVLFGMALTTAVEDGDFVLPLFIIFCGLGFAYDRN